MSSIGEKGQLIPHVIETLSTNKYGNKCMILENLFEIPAVSREFYLSADIKPMRIIRRDYVPQIYQEISTIDFAKINPVPGEHSTYCEDVEALFNTVQENFIAMASIKDNKQFEGYVNGYPMDIVTDTLVRAYVQAEKTPSADIVAMVEKVDKALKRFHRGQLTQSLLEKFTDLAKE
jgi:hypothetical protein